MNTNTISKNVLETFETTKKQLLLNNQEKELILTGYKNMLCYFIKKGKKKVAGRLLKEILYICAKNNNNIDFWQVLNKCLTQNTPYVNVLEIKNKKNRKVSLKVVPITKKIQNKLLYSWIIAPVKSPTVAHFSETLLKELVKVSENQGEYAKKRDDLHKLAIKNAWFIKSKKKATTDLQE